MAREYDFTVLGASGFTGKYVCKEILKKTEGMDVKICFAGRSRKKVEEILNWAASCLNLPESRKNEVGIIVADVSDEQSLISMCKRTKIVLDCVGPFKFLGEPVVRACLEALTDYVDVTGEPEFMERIQHKYHEEAISKGVYIVNACGFDCIPSEMGVKFAKQNFPGTLTGIESYFTLGAGPHGVTGNYGTWASIIHGISDLTSLKNVRTSAGQKRAPVCGPKLKKKGIHYDKKSGAYAMPFAGADPSVVKRTQDYLFYNSNEISTQYMMYSSMGFLQAVATIFFVIIWYLMSRFSWGKNALLKYPEFFSGGFFSSKGPTEQQMATCYVSFLMFCRGYKKKVDTNEVQSMEKEAHNAQMVVKVVGPEAGYVLTPIVMVQSAFCIKEQREALPSSGGVYTPGIAFNNTKLLENLQKNDIKFEVISE